MRKEREQLINLVKLQAKEMEVRFTACTLLNKRLSVRRFVLLSAHILLCYVLGFEG